MLAAKFTVPLNIDRINKSHSKLVNDCISDNIGVNSDSSSSNSEKRSCIKHCDGTKYFNCIHCTGYEGGRQKNGRNIILANNYKYKTNVSNFKNADVMRYKEANGAVNTNTNNYKNIQEYKSVNVAKDAVNWSKKRSRNCSTSSDSSHSYSITSVSKISSCATPMISENNYLCKKGNKKVTKELISKNSESGVIGGIDTNIYYALPEYLDGPIPYKLPSPPLHWCKQKNHIKRSPSTTNLLNAWFNKYPSRVEDSTSFNIAVETLA